MEGIVVVPLVFMFILVAIAMSGFILVSIIKALRGSSGGRDAVNAGNLPWSA